MTFLQSLADELGHGTPRWALDQGVDVGGVAAFGDPAAEDPPKRPAHPRLDDHDTIVRDNDRWTFSPSTGSAVPSTHHWSDDGTRPPNLARFNVLHPRAVVF